VTEYNNAGEEEYDVDDDPRLKANRLHRILNRSQLLLAHTQRVFAEIHGLKASEDMAVRHCAARVRTLRWVGVFEAPIILVAASAPLTAGVTFAFLWNGFWDTALGMAAWADVDLGAKIDFYATRGVSDVVVGKEATRELYGQNARRYLTKLSNETVGAHVSPICCCKPPSEHDASHRCALFPDSNEKCPLNTEHLPHMCTLTEVLRFRNDTTVHGCLCVNYNDCANRWPYRGHAWCRVAGPGRCGFRSVVRGYRWDYCTFAGDALGAMERRFHGQQALAAFIPNPHTSHHYYWHHMGQIPVLGALLSPFDLIPTKATVFPELGLVLHKDWLFSEVECVTGSTAESMGTCALRCLNQGAQVVGMTDSKGVQPCVAFAWNPKLRYCVTLPRKTITATFWPFMKKYTTGDGWQHFAYRYSEDHSCSLSTMRGIRDNGIGTVVRFKGNGHMYIRLRQCSKPTVAKASCLAKDCGGGDFCFVPKHCHSGVGGKWVNACRPIEQPPCAE